MPGRASTLALGIRPGSSPMGIAWPAATSLIMFALAVRLLTERGYPVFAGVRGNAGSLAKLSDVRMVQMDVTDPDSVAAAAKRVEADVRGRGLHAVVNNAGVIVQGPLELVPADELRRQFEVNTYGPTYVSQSFLPLLRASAGRTSKSAPTRARATAPIRHPAPAPSSNTASST